MIGRVDPYTATPAWYVQQQRRREEFWQLRNPNPFPRFRLIRSAIPRPTGAIQTGHPAVLAAGVQHAVGGRPNPGRPAR